MSNSVLTNTKQALGYSEDYTAFDFDIILFINSTFATLNDLGVGPEDGFAIADKTTQWEEFLGDDLRLNSVKTYVYLKVRILHDPPKDQVVMDAYQALIEENTWRICSLQDRKKYTVPFVPDPFSSEIDGGAP